MGTKCGRLHDFLRPSPQHTKGQAANGRLSEIMSQITAYS